MPVVGTTPVGDLLAALGAKTPSPGGGATAALAAALGAAQLRMVAEYSAWESGAPDPRAALGAAVAHLTDLAQRDADEYARFDAARKTRKENPEGFAQAKAAILEVPVAMLESAVGALRTAPAILARAPAWFVCDLAIAVGCLQAAFEGAYLLTVANVKPLAPTVRHPGVGDRVIMARAEFDGLVRSLSPRLLTRLG